MPRNSSHARDGLARIAALLCGVTCVLGCPGFGSGELPEIDLDADREPCEQVQAILDLHCTRCHTKPATNGAPDGIRLDVFEDTDGALGIVTLGPLIVAYAETGTMPPAGEPETPITDREAAIITAWINAGSPIAACTANDRDAGFDTGLDAGFDAADVPMDGSGDAADAPEEIPDIDRTPPSTESVHAEVFARHCASHHINAGSQLPRLDLDGLEERLRSASLQLPSMPWVTPGDPESSYLYRKLEGTHVAAGGSGFRMPIGPALTTADLDLVAAWIEGLAE